MKLFTWIKQLVCKHNFQPTDTEGWSYECSKCGKYKSVWTWL